VTIYRLPPVPRGLLFDMDLTLYTCPAYGAAQIDGLTARLGEHLGLSCKAIKEEVEARRLAWAASHGGARPALSAVFGTFGITMEENIRWREEVCDPAPYLKEDPALRAALAGLAPRYSLGVVTNNPVRVAEKTLAILGVREFFKVIIGLDTCRVSKPDPRPFLAAARALGLPPEACISIGDRYDIDLAPPLALGMGAVLVTGAEDVYRLEAAIVEKTFHEGRQAQQRGPAGDSS